MHSIAVDDIIHYYDKVMPSFNQIKRPRADTPARMRGEPKQMENLNIGSKVQEYRTLRKYSLRKLADLAELTPSMLSQIENNTTNPSINTLKAIAAALDVPMFKFFLDDQPVSDKLVVRKGNYMTLGHSTEGVTYQLLTPDLSGQIEFCLMEITPRSVTASKARSHRGEEVAYVISGSVDLMLDGHRVSLNAGDSVRIPVGMEHVWTNNTDALATVIFAITPPSF